MAHQAQEMKFVATPEKGEVSALLIQPGDATHVLVLGRGASTPIATAVRYACSASLDRPTSAKRIPKLIIMLRCQVLAMRGHVGKVRHHLGGPSF
jgi:hypothetical protein